MFSVIGKGAPAAIKATIVYNDLLRFWGLDKKHSYIVQGDKINIYVIIFNIPFNRFIFT